MLRIFKQYYPIRNVFFVFGEGLFLFLSVVLASRLFLRQAVVSFDHAVWLKAALITAVVQISLYYNDLYDLKQNESFLHVCTRLLQALGIAAILLAVVYFFFPNSIISYGVAEAAIGICIVLIVSWRFCYMLAVERRLFDQKVMIIGSGELAQDIVDEISSKPDCGYAIAAAIAESDQKDFFNLSKAVVFTRDSFSRISDISLDLKIDKIIVALKEKRGALPLEQLLACRVNGFDVLDGNSFYEMLTGKLSVTSLNPAWLIFSEGFRKSLLTVVTKRILDTCLSSVLLILLAPLMAVVAVLIKLDSRGPALFSQERVGHRKKSYIIYKFRTMTVDAEKYSGPVWSEKDDPRVTRVGKFLRKFRIDELPQLWNVLKGEMSFVGPRPERDFFVADLESRIPYYQERFVVKPGVTGWAQIGFGYVATIEDTIEKVNYDLFYIKNMSILMDVLIILRTIKIIIFGKGR